MNASLGLIVEEMRKTKCWVSSVMRRYNKSLLTTRKDNKQLTLFVRFVLCHWRLPVSSRAQIIDAQVCGPKYSTGNVGSRAGWRKLEIVQIVNMKRVPTSQKCSLVKYFKLYIQNNLKIRYLS